MSAYTTEEQKQKKRASSSKYYYANKEKVKLATEKWFDNLSEKKKREFIALRKEKSKAWRKRNPQATRDRREDNARSRFGISLEEYNFRREQQRKEGDLCGLCKRPLDKKPHLDHDHKSGRIRKFLHRNCNLALGLLEDNPVLLRMAAEYLEDTGD